jgi:hypothetical protein
MTTKQISHNKNNTATIRDISQEILLKDRKILETGGAI